MSTCVVCGAERPEVTIVWYLRSYGHQRLIRFLICERCLPGWATSPGVKASSEDTLPDEWQATFSEACPCGRQAVSGPDPVKVVWRQGARGEVREFCTSVCARKWLLDATRSPRPQSSQRQLALF